MNKYHKICQGFVREYLVSRIQGLKRDLSLSNLIPLNELSAILSDPLDTPLGRQTLKIAHAVAGELPWDEASRTAVTEAVHQVTASLASPSGYMVDPVFWNFTPFGRMVRDARLWAKGDELITQTEAARMLGVTVKAVGLSIQRGTLTLYVDATEANSRKNRRVSRMEIEALIAEQAQKAKQKRSAR